VAIDTGDIEGTAAEFGIEPAGLRHAVMKARTYVA
jgi:hypothetical protein